MNRDEIIKKLSQLFDADDMSEMDASDFKDRAVETFDLYLAARALVRASMMDVNPYLVTNIVITELEKFLNIKPIKVVAS